MKKRIKHMGIILTSAILLILAFIILFVTYLMRRDNLPVKSKSGTLILALYADMSALDIEITLSGANGQICTLCSNGVFAGEPQSYRLPELIDSSYTVHLKFNGMDGYSMDMDVADLSAESLLKKGMLIYFSDLHWGVQIICGKTEISFCPDPVSKSYVIDNDPPMRQKDSHAGAGAWYYYSGWRENEWVVS